MAYIKNELNIWAIDKIKKEYKEDIALLIGHEHWTIERDDDAFAFNFFIPRTEKGYNLAQTFIIDGIGYDLFPMSWERVEGLANVNESLTTCLADGNVLYSGSEEEKERFIALQHQLAKNLQDVNFSYHKALEKIDIAMDLYKNMLFETSLCNVRKAGGFIANYLSEALATFNSTFFPRGVEDHIDYIKEFEKVPEGFTELYQQIIEAETLEETKNISFQMLNLVRDFFLHHKPKQEEKAKVYNYDDLASWYEEGSYTFRRIYHYCDEEDVFNAYAWAYFFQNEVDFLHREFGMKKMDLMSVFDALHLSSLRKRAKEVEDYIISVIEGNGSTIRNYDSLESFLKENS